MAWSTALILFLCCYYSIDAKTSTTHTPPTAGITLKPEPPSLEFNCTGGNISDIFGTNIERDAVVIEYQNGTMCRITDLSCNWKNFICYHFQVYYPRQSQSLLNREGLYTISMITMDRLVNLELKNKSTKLHVRYDTSEKHTKIVAGQHPSYFELECKSGYIAKDSASELKIGTNCKSNDKAIMEDRWTKDKNSIKIKMYAFRFVDSKSVTIECSAYICPSSNTECKKEEQLCLNTNNGANRRRRRSNLETYQLDDSKEETSSVSFTIVDRFDERNAGKGVSGNIHLYITVVLITACFIRRE